MGQYVGLDVSLKGISLCVMDGDGTVVHRSTVAADPDAVAQHLAEKKIAPERIVHESGQLSIWLQRGLVRLGLPAVCIDARLAHKALSARPNKPVPDAIGDRAARTPRVWRSWRGPAGTQRSMSAARSPTGSAC